MNTQIKTSNLNFKYGSYTVLENVTFDIEKGEFISIVGPNGGGKSTFLKLLLGLITPFSGTILIDGKKPEKIDSKYIGYVPQLKTTDRSFPAMALELVASGIVSNWIGRINKELKQQCLAALDKVNAVHLATKQLSKLSGGELQRIYLARSIARSPELLLLDEPATGIDTESERDLNKILNEIQRDSLTTVIMVTHDWESAFHHSDKVLILNKELICFDIPETAFSDDSLRTAFGHKGHKHDMIFGAKR